MQGKVNNKEPYVEQGLELTRRIHTNCYNIVETIRWDNYHSTFKQIFPFFRKTGSVSREIRDIQNQIRQEEGRDLRSKLEKLTRDLQTLHRENAEMATFIKSKQK